MIYVEMFALEIVQVNMANKVSWMLTQDAQFVTLTGCHQEILQ